MITDKPGVLGSIGNLGQSVKQGAQKEIKRTVENTMEQLSGKERKPASPAGGEVAPDAAQAEALRKQQSQETANWLYGVSTPAESGPTAASTEKKAEGKGDLKQQLGFEQKIGHTATAAEQIGIKKDIPNTTQANPFEQIMGKSALKTATASEQLNFVPASTKTPEEQQQLAKQKQELHNQYYQGLTTPRKQPETEERMEEAREEQENAQQRMERLKQEDLQEEQKKKEKQKPIDTEPNIEKNRGSSG